MAIQGKRRSRVEAAPLDPQVETTKVPKPIAEVIYMKKSSHMTIPITENKASQQVTEWAKHQFQWSQGTATCSCGRWTLWGASLESAKRSHALHRANLPEQERAQGGPDSMTTKLKRSCTK